MSQRIDIEIGQRLLEVKEDLEFETISSFAETLGVDQSQLSKIINGKLNLTIQMLKELYSLHNVNLNWLIAGKGDVFNKKYNDFIERNQQIFMLDEPENMLNASRKFLHQQHTIENAHQQILQGVNTRLVALQEFVLVNLAELRGTNADVLRAALSTVEAKIAKEEKKTASTRVDEHNQGTSGER